MEWFNEGGEVRIADNMASDQVLKSLQKITPLLLAAKQLKMEAQPETLVSACEFILEGLHALQKINRSEERGYFVERRVTETPPAERQHGQRGRYYDN